ncbi:hypothetical protein ACFL0I_01580 [Gemmatimonadota bacterium]
MADRDPEDPNREDQGSPLPPPRGEEEGRRPTPVRMAMEGTEADAAPQNEEGRRVTEPETGVEWTVEISGRSGSGILPLRTIPLMELTFSRFQDPNHPRRCVLTQGDDILSLSEEDLLHLLGRSEPCRPPKDPPEPEDRPGRRGKSARGSGG